MTGQTKRVSQTNVTVQAVLYGAMYCVGGILTFKNAFQEFIESGIVQFASVDMISARSTAMSLWLFNDNPSSSTVIDNAEFIFHKSDVNKRIAVIPLSLTGVAAASGTNGIQSVYTSGPLAIPTDKTIGGTIYGVLVADVATTMIASDVQKVTIGVLPD